MRTAWLLVGLCACGPYTEERFAEEYAAAQCDWLVGCYPGLYASLDECVAEVGDSPLADDPPCPFAPDAARDCVRGIEQKSCPVGDDWPVEPAACAQVRACDNASE